MGKKVNENDYPEDLKLFKSFASAEDIYKEIAKIIFEKTLPDKPVSLFEKKFEENRDEWKDLFFASIWYVKYQVPGRKNSLFRFFRSSFRTVAEVLNRIKKKKGSQFR